MERKLSFNRLKLVIVALFILTFGAVQIVNAQETLWVLDETNHLSEETLDYITHLNEEIFANFDIEPQLAIEILKELPEGYADIDEYRNERFKELGVGNKEHDSGILLVIALGEREIGLETGYGAEAIVRDIDASQIISGEVQESLGQYMQDLRPAHLNRSIVKAADQISVLLDKGNTGVLFEEREEEEKRADKQVASAKTGIGYFVAAFFGLLGLTRVRSWYKKRKLKELKEKATASYINYYNKDLPAAIQNEISKQVFQSIFEDNFDYYMEKYAPNQEFDEIWQSRPNILTDIRIINYANNIKDFDISLDPRVYLNASKEYQESIEKVPDYTIRDHIEKIDKSHHEKNRQVTTYSSDLIPLIDTELTKHKQSEVGYSSWVFDTKTIHKQLSQKYHLNEEGIITGEVSMADEELVKKDIQQLIYHNIVEDVMRDEFKDSSFGYGNSRAFRSFVIAGILGSMVYLSRDELIQHMEGLLAKYRKREEEKERERIRIAKKRRQEEELRRQQAAMRRSSSSSSSSSGGSGGSFGGGFGGGSSGGGGASGKF